LSTAALLRSFFSLPLVTLKIVAAIHWEAFGWLKGSRTTSQCRTCEHRHQYQLGDRRTQRLYWASVAHPRKSAVVQ
jgi:DUF1365 family protein